MQITQFDYEIVQSHAIDELRDRTGTLLVDFLLLVEDGWLTLIAQPWQDSAVSMPPIIQNWQFLTMHAYLLLGVRQHRLLHSNGLVRLQSTLV